MYIQFQFVRVSIPLALYCVKNFDCTEFVFIKLNFQLKILKLNYHLKRPLGWFLC